MNTLVILGHPNNSSYCAALAENYVKGAEAAGHTTRLLRLADLNFDLNLKMGYQRKQPLEPDLQEAQKLLLWCDHLVVVFPTWWGAPPAVLKGFLDRVLLPGFAFKYRKDSVLWDKLLAGRTARIIVTSDSPGWWMRYRHADPAIRLMKQTTLEFCGFTPVKVSRIDSIKSRKPEALQKGLLEAQKAARMDAGLQRSKLRPSRA
ncbi:NAD(P)H-dependent oxidoreductase [Deinococcus roseus]|uniref:NAD(P)H dehydrogenase (Quinone) n=1 Tax=Deinococcus roseus TaxID=392414 RepID=A0ABQ2D6E4_9DEIO|nr:NAD(P)H-dependent oxidoreductase [Deinococcus roseus]GGJ45364.1 NAD(P)H dehydrogenase (quinone) [Deinococcus roseus]